MDEDKEMIEFLKGLIELNQNNIYFILKQPTQEIRNWKKYKEELQKVGDLINSFDWDKGKKNG